LEYSISRIGSGKKPVYVTYADIESDKQKEEECVTRYNRLTNILYKIRRDYNYIANRTPLDARKAKLRKGATEEAWELDYLIPYTQTDLIERNTLMVLRGADVEPIEYCEDNGEVLDVLEKRNKLNKVRICSVLLSILNQPVSDAENGVIRVLVNWMLECIGKLYEASIQEYNRCANLSTYKTQVEDVQSFRNRQNLVKTKSLAGDDLTRAVSNIFKTRLVIEERQVPTEEVAGGANLFSSDDTIETNAHRMIPDRFEGVPDGDYGRMDANLLMGEDDFQNEDEI
jgi:hypothetical protein